MPLLELPCVFALVYLWCWTCVEVAVRAGRNPYWGGLGLFCSPTIALVFLWPEVEEDHELPPQQTRLRVAALLTFAQLGLMLGIAAWYWPR